MQIYLTVQILVKSPQKDMCTLLLEHKLSMATRCKHTQHTQNYGVFGKMASDLSHAELHSYLSSLTFVDVTYNKRRTCLLFNLPWDRQVLISF